MKKKWFHYTEPHTYSIKISIHTYYLTNFGHIFGKSDPNQYLFIHKPMNKKWLQRSSAGNGSYKVLLRERQFIQWVTKIHIELILKLVFFADISGTTWAIKKVFNIYLHPFWNPVTKSADICKNAVLPEKK